ncbi:MAG: ABC transporter ATP-binding protein [Desulfovibrionaceae bacterium]
MTDPLVLLDNVHLTLPGPNGAVNVLCGVDLRMDAGEAVSVVGPSGSGKTSMLMVMAGLEKPSSGTVRVAGHDLAAMNEDALARFRRGRVGIVFQAFHLIPAMTALENVALPLEFDRANTHGRADAPGRANARDRAMASLEAVGLADRMHHYPAQLSGGEQQRVAIARAFAPAPALLLADEPTGNLDPETGGAVIDLLFALREQAGSTLLLITHDRSLADRAGRSVRMRGGRLVDGDATAAGAKASRS